MTHLNRWSSLLLLPVAPDVPLAAKANLAVTSKRGTCSTYGNLCSKIVFLDVYVTDSPMYLFLHNQQETNRPSQRT